MEIMLWNCTGANVDPTQQALKDMIRKYQPAMLFLCETKLDEEEECRRLCLALGFDQFASNLSLGQSGGLLLLWRDCINVRFRSDSRHHIDVAIDIEEAKRPSWRFTGCYGHPITSEIANTWALLKEDWKIMTWAPLGAKTAEEEQRRQELPDSGLDPYGTAKASVICNMVSLPNQAAVTARQGGRATAKIGFGEVGSGLQELTK